MRKILKYNSKNKENARNLRCLMTDAEQLLWSRVRRKQVCGIQFNRQKSIGSYIVDFCAPSVNIIIEIDGGQHFEEEHMKRDEKRYQYLKSLGLVVLRFDNLQVLKEIDAVLEVIFLEVEKSLKSPRLDRLTPLSSAPFAKGAGSKGAGSSSDLLPNQCS